MRNYKRLFIWENINRTTDLIEFRNLIVQYFDNTQLSLSSVKENEEARKARRKINLVMQKTHNFILEAGVSPDIIYRHPPSIGGRSEVIDLVSDIFHLHNFGVSPELLLDCIERAIGVYQNDKIKSIFRTTNPFFWAYLILDFIISIPFRLLGLVGFDQIKAEESLVGRVLKFVFVLIILSEALLNILEKVGYLEKFKSLIIK